MDFEKLCAERYSLRKYADRPVEAEKLEKVLEAGHNAPTAHNLQPQRILVMQSREALEKAEECTACKFHMKNLRRKSCRKYFCKIKPILLCQYFLHCLSDLVALAVCEEILLKLVTG